MATLIQTSFAAGELGPALHGRVDIAKYAIGLAKALNVFVHPHGGISNRAGLEYVGPCGGFSTTSRLIPFQFNTEQTYALEFGNTYMRVVKDGGHVIKTTKAITGATAANPVVITAPAHGYASGTQIFIDGVVGMTRLNGRHFIIDNITTNTFQLRDHFGYIDGTSFPAYVSGGTANEIFTLGTAYSDGQMPTVKFVQSADVMTLTHRNHVVRELSRSGHASWALNPVTFEPGISFPTGLTSAAATAGAEVYRYRVTAVAEESFEESLPALGASNPITAATQANPVVITYTGADPKDGDEIYITGIGGMTQLNGRRFIIGSVNAGANQFSLQDEDGTAHSAYTSGGAYYLTFAEQTSAALSSTNTVTLTFTGVPGAQRYDVYRQKNGIYGYIGTTETLSFEDDNIAPDVNTSPPRARNPFLGSNNQPGVVSYYEQRRVFGGSYNKPDTSWYTQTGNFANMTASSPVRDDDAITASLNARKVNEIRHFIPMNDLVILTSGAEWKAGSGGDSAFGPNTIKQKVQSEWGSSHVPPVLIGNTVLFVQARGSMVRSFSYDASAAAYTGGYDGTDLTILSSHLFEGKTVVDWAYAQIPDSIVWCVLSDGTALSLTYNKEQQVVAWTSHETDGWFESVASVPESADNADAVYFIVRRIVNGNTVRNVERLHSRVITKNFDVKECFFVDCGVTYRGSPAKIIPGLDHLEGKTVVALADGNVVSNLVVTDGTVELPNESSVVHVGLPYVSDIETLNIEAPQGTIQGKLKKISSVVVRFLRSRGLKIGPDFDSLTEMKWRENELMGDPTALLTDDKEETLEPSWNSNGRIALRQENPLPMTILALIPEINVGG